MYIYLSDHMATVTNSSVARYRLDRQLKQMKRSRRDMPWPGLSPGLCYSVSGLRGMCVAALHSRNKLATKPSAISLTLEMGIRKDEQTRQCTYFFPTVFG
jgi:hypothetical protein